MSHKQDHGGHFCDSSMLPAGFLFSYNFRPDQLTDDQLEHNSQQLHPKLDSREQSSPREHQLPPAISLHDPHHLHVDQWAAADLDNRWGHDPNQTYDHS